MEASLFIHEIFPSFQGEGILVGVPQVFVRLSGCNLRCSYCDTPESRERVEGCAVYGWEGERETLANPLGAAEVAGLVSSLWDAGMHSLSLTGGEPLLQAAGLEALLPAFKREGVPVYLETNGTLVDALDGVLPWLDHVAMDIKLPSSQGGEDLTERQRDFLARMPPGRVFLKMVIGVETGDGEAEVACRALGEPAIAETLVLQPATPREGSQAISSGRAHELYSIARRFFADVRVIPQAHRAWGVR
ncbi:MAG: 7-carboxy-7-deazaguanine synthase QueE [Actinomycetota bacterium]|nr:7-carboxy-7-deazaguanine synthase QueE [Actinomycetota bacterium]MDD5667018.1 7-carboxy-7-deazaguanine synthase QueE [Actinomycetota bacterium]